MSTRANILIINSDKTVTQYYHHCDGYPKVVGEELRRCCLIGLGLNRISNNDIDDAVKSILKTDPQYEEEYTMSLKDSHRLHGDIEYLYVLDLANQTENNVSLYCRKAYGIYREYHKNIELINSICVEENKIDITKQIQ